ncbi:MAG: DNA-directed RNA polymerase subunit beta [Anaerolineales bacterium]
MVASEVMHTAPKNSLATHRKSYARSLEIISIPDLIKTQLESFEDFQNDKLRELFDEISPIVSFNENLELHFPGYGKLNQEFGLDYRFDEPAYSEKECRRRGATYAAPLYVKVLLYNKKTDQPIVQEVYMGDFPVMTSTGTFIINGTERVIVSQLIRSPGAYFETELDRRSGRLLCEAKLIPDRGAWLQFQTSRRDYISVRVDRKRKMPVTVLIRALGAVSDGIDDVPLEKGSDEELKALFEDVDTDPDRSYLDATLDRDTTTSAEEALKEAYKKLRPGDPLTLEKAKSYLEYLLFNPRRYDLGRVGRYKMNRHFENNLPLKRGTLTKRDLTSIVRHMFKVNNGVEPPDDMDHLGNRRIKTVGELIQNKLRVGFLRMERVVRERMSSRDPDQASPISLINVRPVTAVLREFFGGSQLSQFMGQTNPLDELTHKRTLSALGPGGLKRQHAGFEVRDVHLSHYGRICPIETPEGPNIGLIGRLATYAEVNDYGFVETPYRRVWNVVPNDPEELVGREVHQPVVNPETGEVLADEGTVIDEKLAEKMAEWDVEEYQVRPFVTDEIEFLSADEEERYVIAQANSKVDDLGQFVSDRVSIRFRERFLFEDIERVSFMDVSPQQIVGVSASLIPFLEHDDANRALMGANMQRQAVPLLRPQAPTIGTGMEGDAAVDSGQLVTAGMEGEVVRVGGGEIVIDGSQNGHVETHTLRKFDRSNQSTCINQRPLVEKGDHVEPGQVIADNMSTENGELALGDNVLCAFISWGGANFEDAVIVSEGLVHEDRFTSIHIEEHEIEARDTKLGMEEITRDIPNVAEDALAKLDEEGIIYMGARVGSGDILVGKITPKGEKELTPEEKLLRAIFGEKAREVRDSSLRLPHGDEGKVIDVREFTRDDNRDMKAGVEKMVIVSVAQRRRLMVGDKMAGRHGNKGVISQIVPIQDMPFLEDGRPIEVLLNPLGVPGRMNIGQVLETHLGWAAEHLGFRVSSPVSDGASEDEIAAELARAWLIDRARHDMKEQTWAWLDEQDIDTESFTDDEEAMVFYLGNFLSDQKSARDISDILASKVESRRVWLRYWLQERGYDVDDVMVYEGSGLSLEEKETADALAREACLRLWLQDAGEDVDDLSPEEVDARALDVSQETNIPLPTTGKMILYDGRTGQRFDEPVTVGSIYMLKLDHLVEDKVHARSTGPYSLVTQQPLGGKAQFGGQRFGEMEVWALEAYGAAHTLQEMLTIKSDDVTGRVKTYESIVKGQPITDVDIPESFRVLVKELQGLGLSVEVYNKKGESYQFAREDRTEMLPRLGFGLGFGPSS